MSDRRDDEFDELAELDEDDNERPPRPAREGVRILGADEARAVMESGRAQPRRSEDEPKFGDVPPRPDPGVRPAARFPQPQEDPPPVSWSASQEGLVPEEPPSDQPIPAPPPPPVPPPGRGAQARRTDQSGPVQLPHWSEPATGEVPIILPEEEGVGPEESAEDEAWSAFASRAPRFRGGAEDWTDADFDPASLRDDSAPLGALADEPYDDDPLADEERFERQLAHRRPRRAGAGAREPRPSEPALDERAPDEPALDERAPDEPALGEAALGEATLGEATLGEAPADEPGTAERAPTPRRRPRSRPRVDDAGDDGPGPPPPDLTVRFITAGIMVVVALAAFFIGRGATAVLVALIVGLGAVELYEGMRRRGFNPATPLGLLASMALVVVAYLQGPAAYPMVFMLVMVFSLLWYLAEVVRARPVSGLGSTLLGFAYVGGLGSFAGLLLTAPNGIGLLVGVALCAIAYDVAGYFVGSQFGKRPLLPHISPNKTVEGLVGGVIAAIVVGMLTSTLLGLTPWDGKASYGLWLGLVVAVAAPLGDLFESMLKRDLGLKDLGTVLPGHGGVLDRFDGVLLSLPAAYYLVLHLGIG